MVVRMLKRALMLGLVLVAVASSGAVAGEYHLYSCRTPAGEVAPSDGWSGSVSAGGAWDDYAIESCGQPGGALIAALGDATVHVVGRDVATWAFQAPPATRIAAAKLWRAGENDGMYASGSYRFWVAGAEQSQLIDDCDYLLGCPAEGELAQPFAPANLVQAPPADLGGALNLNVSCEGAAGFECPAGTGYPNGYTTALYLYAADITLEQNAGPIVSGVGGALASAALVSGSSDVTFTATDPGSGVYEALFSIDGQVVQSTVVDENGGRCRDVGESTDGLAAFLYAQPCLGTIGADVPLDTTLVKNGAHHLIVSVIDAAGNSAPVLDREITVANPGAPGPANGTNASSQATLSVSWKGTSRARLAGRYGRVQVLDGRLSAPGGAPIAGALIEVLATPVAAGSATVAMADARTGPDGRFSVRLPAGTSSRRLRFEYRSHLGEARAAATRTLSLSVGAGILLRVAPRTAGVGRRIYFHGRLLGGPIPPAGKALVLEARSPGGPWIEFDVIRSDGRGRFHSSYRFKFPGPASYEFRAFSEVESDYPFAAGSSNVVGVQEH